MVLGNYSITSRWFELNTVSLFRATDYQHFRLNKASEQEEMYIYKINVL